MKQYIESIEKSLIDQNYFGALSIALMLPDICSAIESQKKTDKHDYCKWFDTYIAHHYVIEYTDKVKVFFSAKECYALRCSYLHQGIHDIAHQHILFNEKDKSEKIKFMAQMQCDNILIQKTLCLNLENFCKNVISGVKTWLEKNKHNELVIESIQALPKVHVSSFSPIGGVRIG